MKVVMVFGAFDGFHPGHLDFFKQARAYGDILVVSVGTDRNVEKIKGNFKSLNFAVVLASARTYNLSQYLQ